MYLDYLLNVLVVNMIFLFDRVCDIYVCIMILCRLCSLRSPVNLCLDNNYVYPMDMVFLHDSD